MKRTITLCCPGLLAILIMFSMSFSGHGQVAGTTSTSAENVIFQKNLKNFTLDPNAFVGKRVGFTQSIGGEISLGTGTDVINSALKSAGISIPDWVSELTSLGFVSDIICFDIDPVAKAKANIDLGGYFQVHSSGDAAINIEYPVRVSVRYPAENTFGCGHTIKIETFYEILSSETAKLQVEAPFFEQEFGISISNFSMEVELGLKGWRGWQTLVAGCVDKDYFNITEKFSLNPTLPAIPPFFNICSKAFGPGASQVSLFSCTLGSGSTTFLSLIQDEIDDYNRRKNKNYRLATFPDHHTVLMEMPMIKELILPEMYASFRKAKNSDLKYESLNQGHLLKVSGKKNRVAHIDLDLVSLLEYKKIKTRQNFGDKIILDAGDIAPTIETHQVMDFQYLPEIHMKIDLQKQMYYGVYNQDGSFSHGGFGRLVELMAGQYIEAVFPQDQRQPILTGLESVMKGDFKSFVKHDYHMNFQINIGQLKINNKEHTLASKKLADWNFGSQTLLNNVLPVESDIIPLTSILLDPEDPIITIDYVNIQDEMNLGRGERAVVYKIGITNDGDVKLNDLKLYFDLQETYAGATHFSVECKSSEEFTLNGAYNGAGDIQLLAAGSSLLPGESAAVEVLVKVKPAISAISPRGCFEPVEYHAKAKATGVSPIGTFVENNFDHCTQQRTGEDLIATVNLGASIIESIHDFTLYGWDEVKIDKPQALSFGNVGSGGDIIFENTSFQNTDPTVVIGDLHARGQLFLQGQSVLEADYIALAKDVKVPNWKSGLMIHGALSEKSKCVDLQPLFNNNSKPLKAKERTEVKKGQNLVLAPGDYDWIRLSEDAEVTFSSGEYNIGRWIFLGDNATIRYQGPVTMNIDIWQALGRKNTQFILEGTGSVNDIVYNYSGNQKCSFHSSLVQGRIFAPRAEIEFTNGSVLEGTCYAKNINFKTGSSFKNPKYLLPINIHPNCQEILIPGELMDEIAQASDISLKREDLMLFSADALKIFPNPTHNTFTISGLPEFKNLGIRIFNSMGTLVHQQFSNSSELQINLENQPPGLYYLEVEGFKSMVIMKL